jgi:glutamate transport system substrate-binding protein
MRRSTTPSLSRPATSRRAIARIAAAAVLALGVSACGGGDSAETAEPGASPSPAASFEPGTTMATLSQAGEITVGTKFDQPLFGLKGLSGQPEGFDVEIAKIIAAALGIPEDGVTFVETPSAVREEKIETDEVDMVVATYTINDQRKERVSFAGPYYQAGQDLMVTADNTEITGPESLRPTGSVVCSVTGSTPAEKIREYVDPANLVLFDVYSKCADALRTGQVDAVTTDNVILLGLVDASDDEFKLVGEPFTEEPYGIGIKKGDVAFCEFINDTLTAAAEDGRYAEAWTSTAGSVQEEVPELPTLAPCT